jgi:dTDP-4-dehydrorhamnose 3,5-epimerase-like enzyme
MTTISDVKFFRFRKFEEEDGNLIPIESGFDVPFKVERLFYVFGVNNQNERGKHSHYTTKQVLICLGGEIEVLVDDGTNKKTYILDNKEYGLYIPEMIWDEQIYKTNDSVLLVLCNTNYDIKDYIEDYDEFKNMKL